MKIITHQDFLDLSLPTTCCMQWIREAFALKGDVALPPKISMKQDQDVFINSMPCAIPSERMFGIKIVSRYPAQTPALKSTLLLYSLDSGQLLALMDADWITAMRTGAVAAHSILALRKRQSNRLALLGLGNTARATLCCLLDSTPDEQWHVSLLAYKGQEVELMNRFAGYDNVTFTLFQERESLFAQNDVIVSCITATHTLLAPDECYQEGVLVVPIHTRGFQNCDLFFDKVFADDRSHVAGFKYFDQFRQFNETGDVIAGRIEGRTNDKERILVYNIGIALHDVYFASKILALVEGKMDVPVFEVKEKFWI